MEVGVYSAEWLLSSSPSRRDGISHETEMLYKQQCCQMIDGVAPGLHVPRWVACTAQYYLHHYYAVESLLRADRYIMAMAAFFVACKVEEVARPLDHVVRECWKLRVAHCSGLADSERGAELGRYAEKTDEMLDAVLAGERALFYTFAFELPAFIVHHNVNNLGSAGAPLGHLMDRPGGGNAVRLAWELVDSIMASEMCLKYTQHELTWALLLFAARVLGCAEELYADEKTPLWVADGVTDGARLERCGQELLAVVPRRAHPLPHDAS